MALLKSTPINDLVYGYIYVTPLERQIIDLPIFQRLRFIKQNSSGYLTFPSNKLERFSHSLGVMHLGGEMLVNACRNAEPDIFEEFVRGLKMDIVDTICLKHSIEYSKLKEDWMANFGNCSNFDFSLLFSPKFTRDENLAYDDYIFAFNIIWQSLRIGCCLHDIGHFPYSHVLEEAIADFGGKKNSSYKPVAEIRSIFEDNINRYSGDLGKNFKDKELPVHEQISAILFIKYINPSYSESSITDLFRICKAIGIRLFLTHRHKQTKTHPVIHDTADILYCLHTIISSDLDADRMDYTMRDCIYAGLDVGKFDYKR